MTLTTDRRILTEMSHLFSSLLDTPDVVTDDQKMTVHGLKIFRAGTFKDSMGNEATWDPIHLSQMELHFSHLHNSGTFPNVPLREGHVFNIQSVIGYVTRVFRDGNYLRADLQFTEPDKFAKWVRGTYRARSLEVSAYESNAGATYWPTVFGLAFVDIPAVEGLYSKQDGKGHVYEQVTPLAENGTPATTTPPNPPAQSPPAQPAATNFTNVPAPAMTAPPSAQSFTINQGQKDECKVQDFTAVQAHITQLETRNRTLETHFQESVKAARNNFVDQLVKDNKIIAPQAESMKTLAASMNDEQFENFKKVYETAPTAPLLGTFTTGTSNHNGTGGGVASRIGELKEIVDMLALTEGREFAMKSEPGKELARLTASTS